MSDLENLEKRLAAAIAKLPRQGQMGAENAALKSELVALKAQRRKDVVELDTLLAKLKPLLEETGNA